MTDIIRLRVLGDPKSKGSFRAVRFPNQRYTRVTNALPGTKPWQNRVESAAQDVAPEGGPWTGPVRLDIVFGMRRPLRLGKRVVRHSRRPDLDKLLRCVLDSLAGVIYRDDSQVSEIVSRKEYADAPGVLIEARRLREVEPENK